MAQTKSAATLLERQAAAVCDGSWTAVDRLIDVKAVAALLGVSDRTVWKLNYAAKLPPPVRVNRSVRWRLSDIQRYIALGCDITAFNASKE